MSDSYMDDYAERMHRAGYQAYEDHVLGVEQIPLKSLYHDWGPLQQTEPQSPAARVIPGWLPLAAYGTGLALGESKPLSGIGDMLTPNVNSVAMEGPMRFAGRGIPRWNDYPGVDAPELIPIAPSVPMDPPRFPTLPGRAPIHPPLAAEPYIPPSHSGRHPPDSTMIVPEVVYPEAATEIGQEVIGADTRSEWERWRDSFREDWKAR